MRKKETALSTRILSTTFVAAMGFLSGCQTVGGEFGQPNVSQITPILEPIQIGMSNVLDATSQISTTMDFYKDGSSGSIETNINGKLDFILSEGQKTSRFTVVDTRVSQENITADIREIKEGLSKLEGVTIEIVFDKSLGGAKVRAIKNGRELPISKSELASLNVTLSLFEQTYLGGRTVSQGQEVFSVNASRLFGPMGGKFKNYSDPLVTARVIGQAIIDERPVIALKSVMQIKEGNEALTIDSTYFVDTFTGVGSYATVNIGGSALSDGMTIKVTTHQWTKFPTGYTAQGSAGSTSTAIPQTDGELRPIAVRWEGYNELFAGTVLLKQGDGSGSVSIQLPNNDGSCNGLFQATTSSGSVWSVSCTNGLAASGTSKGLGPGKGAIGEGTDTQGRKVSFTLGGRS